MHRDSHPSSTHSTSQPIRGRRKARPARPDQNVANQHHELLVGLIRELFQAERSAERHALREAERLGDTPPAQALRAASRHAAQVLRELPAAVEASRVGGAAAGRTLGELLSLLRDNAIDFLVDAERSYRATLLGLRHGVDLVRMIQHVTDASGDVELGGFCARWLGEREPLVHGVEVAMTWFAEKPGVAIHSGKWLPNLPLLRRRRSAQHN